MLIQQIVFCLFLALNFKTANKTFLTISNLLFIQFKLTAYIHIGIIYNLYYLCKNISILILVFDLLFTLKVGSKTIVLNFSLFLFIKCS